MAYDPSHWFRYGQQQQQTDEGAEIPNDVQNHRQIYRANNDNDFMVTAGPFYDSTSNSRGVEYDPLSPAINSTNDFHFISQQSKPDPTKLDNYITMLQKFIRPLPHEYKKMLTYDVICQIAHTMLDGTVLDIAKGLRDIQTITEKNLSSKRQKLLEELKLKKDAVLKRHKSEMEGTQGRAHQIVLIERKHTEELKILREKREKELSALDQKLVLELDQQVSDQQATLERAGMPLFFITNKPEEVRMQMYLLEFLLKLSMQR